jgi:tetratricopeptide (TPR) repeat protein
VNADQPWAHVNLGVLAADLGDVAGAEAAAPAALRADSGFVPAYVNLADSSAWPAARTPPRRRCGGRSSRRRAADRTSRSYAARAHRPPRRSLPSWRAQPRSRWRTVASRWRSRFARRARRRERALATLEAALARRPGDRDLRATAALLARDHGQAELALRHAHALVEAWPDDARARELLASLER